MLLCLSGCAKYGVLISTNEVIVDDVAYHSEWWYDLVLQYQMLRENGFKDENIYVLYGDGTDFDTSHCAYNADAIFGNSITDMPVNKTNIEQIFNDLRAKINRFDHLYIWWMGHGFGSGPGQCDLSMQISNTGEYVSDAEFKGYIDNVNAYRKRTIAVMTCHAGGIVNDFSAAGDKTVVFASSTCAESSYDATATCNNMLHADFNYTFPNALKEKDPCMCMVPSDADNNGLVSLDEAHQYNQNAMTTSTPQMGDTDNIAGSTYLKKNRP
jgi:hypothetical protein